MFGGMQDEQGPLDSCPLAEHSCPRAVSKAPIKALQPLPSCGYLEIMWAALNGRGATEKPSETDMGWLQMMV